MQMDDRNRDPYKLYKTLRNKLKKKDGLSWVLSAINRLHWVHRGTMEDFRKWNPWRLLLIIKWALINCEDKHPQVSLAEDKDLIPAMNAVHEMEGLKNRFLGRGLPHGAIKFMRTLAFQQFWLQRRLVAHEIGRQLHLFSGITTSYAMKEKFASQSGLSLQAWFEFVTATWIKLGGLASAANQFMERKWLSPLETFYTNGEGERFLQLISLTPEGAGVFLREKAKGVPTDLQLVEQTPLKEYPLLRIGNNYYCYCPAVFDETVRFFLYDFMKRAFPQEFSSAFGKIMERYLEEGLRFCDFNYLTEGHVKKKFAGRPVDFIVQGSEATLLIESKAVEMAPLARINPQDIVLRNALTNRISEALKQLYSVAHAISARELDIDTNRKEIFGIVVTYKELYLGGAKGIWEEVFNEDLRQFFAEKKIDPGVLPQEKIFFLSVEDFDAVISICAGHKERLVEVLQRAYESEVGDPKERKFVFAMHLDKWPREERSSLPYVEKAYDEAFEKLIGKMKSLEESEKQQIG